MGPLKRARLVYRLSPLAGEPNKLETSGVKPQGRIFHGTSPHSLGNPINWKPIHQDGDVLIIHLDSPLAGEPNKLETLYRGKLVPSKGRKTSPLAGEPNKLETPEEKEKW